VEFRTCFVRYADGPPKGKLPNGKGRGKMEKWEYLTLYISGDDWFDGDGKSGTLPSLDFRPYAVASRVAGQEAGGLSATGVGDGGSEK
jgi:hypothetical protein